MQQIFKSIHPFRRVLAVMLTLALFCGCGNGSQNTDTPKTDSMPATTPRADTIRGSAADSANKMKDSLPPIDPSASTRPETRKTR